MSEPAATISSGERILVVDDSKVQLFAMSTMLKKEGFEVESTHEPLTAKNMIEQKGYDLLLCDLIMPDMDGIGLLRVSKSKRPTMPVVIMTAFGDRESAIQALKEGAEDYIFKASGDRERDEFIIRIRRALERAKLQKKIFDYQTHLEQMVDERTQELKATQDQLVQSERLRSLGVITSGVAHDFNNILAVILGRSQLLSQKIHDTDVSKDLDMITRSALKGSATIKRMQDYTRIRKDERFESIALNSMLEEVIEMTKTRWQDESNSLGVTINLQSQFGDVPLVSGDASELKDVFINIIFNSVDAMREGGTLSIRTYTEQIENTLWVVTELSDTGCGIPENIQSKVFDPFFTTKNQHGSGLGMSTAYGIVQRHRGHLSFKSKPGEGTTFYVKLMAALFVQQLAPDVARAKEVGPPKPLSVLVVDDDEAVRTTLVEMLEIQDHEVHQAGSGKEALRMIEERSFDIVFTDLGMPGMSGWEVSQEIKKRAPQTNIVMITGWGSQLDKEKAEQTGIQRILPKPVSFDEIVRAVTDFGLPLKS